MKPYKIRPSKSKPGRFVILKWRNHNWMIVTEQTFREIAEAMNYLQLRTLAAI